MRILFVQRFCLRTVGCAVRATRLCEELARRGHAVTLIDFPHARRLAEYGPMRALPEGVEVVALERRATALPGNLSRIRRLARRADVVHLWKSYPDAGLPAVWGAYLADRPLHYDWDDWEPEVTRALTGSAALADLLSRYDRLLPTLADTVSAASHALMDEARRLGVPDDQLFYLPVGADSAPVLPSPGNASHSPRLIYVGQLESVQQAEICLHVVKALVEQGCEVELEMVGDGPARPALEARAEALGIRARVHFMGYRRDVAARLAGADLALLPFQDTQMERCKSPLKVAEALAAGLPVVSNRVGDVPEMVGEAGRLVPAGDVPGLAAAVREILSGLPLEREAWRARAQARAGHYTWPRAAETLERAYLTATRRERRKHEEEGSQAEA